MTVAPCLAPPQQRTHWHDILGSHCPKFGVKRLVAVPLPQPQGYKAADEYKLQLSFDGEEQRLVFMHAHLAAAPSTELRRACPPPPPPPLLLQATRTSPPG